ncbi:MAG: TIGR01777 family oxidoreductase [Acidimicrobiia bacterium]
MRVAATGASGLIGQALCARLEGAGYEVLRLVRAPVGSTSENAPVKGIARWDPDGGWDDAEVLQDCSAVVHLAGESVGLGRWSEAKKARILESRERGTSVLARALAGLPQPPPVLVSASAIGWYGDRGDEVLTEASASGTGFLAEVCRRWEVATEPARQAGIRVVLARTGIVLDRRGGSLARQLLPFRLGLGGPLGSGRQWVSWITLADEVSALVRLLGEVELAGPVNLTAPGSVTGAEFARALGKALGRPALLPLPAFALSLVLGGERARELVLASQRVRPERLVAGGFTFEHPELATALAAVLRKDLPRG